ncbi:MAG: type II secretion system inner membrane protein GspF [Myxococcales bacterium]|nr:type II secretion system inner membrane protein GspF [Myxococcales bacterium]
MAIYEYKGVDASGKQIKGVLDADSPRILRLQLRKQGVYLTQYVETTSTGKRETKRSNTMEAAGTREVEIRGAFQRIKLMEIAIVTRQMATLVRAGIPVVDSLNACVDQTDNPKLKKVLTQVKTSVNEGAALAGALGEHPKVFNDLYVNMVRAGESSGTLDIVFQRLADFQESQVKLRTKLVGALTYPFIMLLVAFAIVTLMMVFVVPKITEMFEEMGAQLPFVTRMLIGSSELFRTYWWIAAIGIFVFQWRFRKWSKTDNGRRFIDRAMLKLPVFGDLFRMVAVSRFAKTFGTLLASGVPLLTSLEIVKNVVNNVILADVIDSARTAIKEGAGIALPLQKSKEFPPMMTHMIAIGEKTGQLEEMLKNVSDAYETQVDSRVSQLTAVLEPIMIVGMGVGVAFLVFAILMPMLQMNEVISGAS